MASTTPSAQDRSDRLAREMIRERRRWRAGTSNYGITYYTTRIVLIVATAVVAAKEKSGWQSRDLVDRMGASVGTRRRRHHGTGHVAQATAEMERVHGVPGCPNGPDDSYGERPVDRRHTEGIRQAS
jgi:ribosome-binding protein aMBF1 (putative translation factor)